MKNSKQNLKSVKTEELAKKALSLKSEIHALRFKGKGAKSKNVKQVASLKKEVARVLTEINQRK